MLEHNLIELASIIVLGVAAQWIAWRLRMPAIVFLLVIGFLAGPVTGFLNPDRLLGDLLLPVVSISVAVILFEGGLTLRVSELREIGRVVIALITLGLLVTWALSAAAAYFVLGFNLDLSVLLGAILVVTGPTVIGPLLRHVRPKGRVGVILKWEGIVIDPIGALLAVLVFEVILIGGLEEAGLAVLFVLTKTVFFGTVFGLLAAVIVMQLLKRFWIPDYLQESVALMFVLAAFTGSNHFQAESGLFAATLMGLAMDNQKHFSIKHIVEFKENLRVLIISGLFVLLAARLQLEDINRLSLASLPFLAFLIFVARPVAVAVSTLGSNLNWRERVFLSWLAPRGIVAAAVSSIFALRMAEEGMPEAEFLVPATFLVIVGTVTLYGLTAGPIARWLKVAEAHPQGVLMVGAHPWARAIAKALDEKGLRVLMVDANRSNVVEARLRGFDAYYGSVHAEHILDDLDLTGIGRLLAVTPNDEANSLAALNFSEAFESEELYQLAPETQGDKEVGTAPKHLRARYLFRSDSGFYDLSSKYQQGWTVKATKLSEEFDFEAYRRNYRDSFVPMFVINESGKLGVVTADRDISPKAGQTVIALVPEK